MSDSELPSWVKAVTPQTPRKIRLSRNWKAWIGFFNLIQLFRNRNLLINGQLEKGTISKVPTFIRSRSNALEISYTWHGKYKTFKGAGLMVYGYHKFSEVYVLIGEKEEQVCVYDENFEWEVVPDYKGTFE